MILRNRGQSKKTEGQAGPKSKGGSLAVGTYFKEAVPPPALPGCVLIAQHTPSSPKSNTFPPVSPFPNVPDTHQRSENRGERVFFH